MKLVFDLDGTLFASGELATKAFKRVFDELGLMSPSDQDLVNTLGYPINEIWEMLLPNESEEVKSKASSLMEEIENQMIKDGEGNLFPEVIETLEKLRDRGHKLYILSNCDEPYLDIVSEVFKLEEIFTKRYCASMFPGKSKTEILKKILDGDTVGIMVGDRFHDITAGKDNSISTVWCNYGYSKEELKPDFEIATFSELYGIVLSLEDKI